MNLLPIIYTSLMIFTGFVLFVVTISYITYKIKEKNRVQHNSAPINLTANYIDHNHTVKSPVSHQRDYSYEYAVQEMENLNHHAAKENYVANRHQETRYYNSPQERRTKVETPKSSKHRYVPSVDYGVRHSSTRYTQSNSRFDVINNQVVNSGGGAAINKSNFNVLNYYADENDLHFPKNYSRVS